jgi:signal transduction histidine kinase
MGDVDVERAALADCLRARRTAILDAWHVAIRRDPALTTGDVLPRAQLFDHMPAMLTSFERQLKSLPADQIGSAAAAAQQSAAAHGLQRWQQGYGLREVTRELGKLNECVLAELDAYAAANPQVSHPAMAGARRMWAALCGTAIEESVDQYFQLQQQEAAGHVKDLESAVAEIRQLEQQRGDLWRQAAHDLRGNLGVVANATVGLAHGGLVETKRDDFVRILMRNVTTLHHLLDDVTSLARLQAGREHRQIDALDISPIVLELCEGIRPLAQQRRLFLRCDGPPGFAADGDAVKIRRIAQNLILNAVKFTHDGGITVSWGDAGADDPKRWELRVMDTGPGIYSGSGEMMAQALETGDQPPPGPRGDPPAPRVDPSSRGDPPAPSGESPVPRGDQQAIRGGNDRPGGAESGEGIGLSIVKRLCELLDATIQLKSTKGVGTTFRILFPRQYSN